MAGTKSQRRIEASLRRGDWSAARRLLQLELNRDPNNHWLLTQIGATWYEQRRYKSALKYLIRSIRIVPDCPLTLWNLAGTLDDLNRPEKAIPIYVRLIRSTTRASDDPCWESPEWSDTLKVDCVFRLGVCLMRSGKPWAAEECFRNYVQLVLAGRTGSYSLEDARLEILSLGNRSTLRIPSDDLFERVGAALKSVGVTQSSQRLDLKKLLAI